MKTLESINALNCSEEKKIMIWLFLHNTPKNGAEKLKQNVTLDLLATKNSLRKQNASWVEFEEKERFI